VPEIDALGRQDHRQHNNRKGDSHLLASPRARIWGGSSSAMVHAVFQRRFVFGTLSHPHSLHQSQLSYTTSELAVAAGISQMDAALCGVR
jgi:hypothetical protein